METHQGVAMHHAEVNAAEGDYMGAASAAIYVAYHTPACEEAYRVMKLCTKNLLTGFRMRWTEIDERIYHITNVAVTDFYSKITDAPREFSAQCGSDSVTFRCEKCSVTHKGFDRAHQHSICNHHMKMIMGLEKERRALGVEKDHPEDLGYNENVNDLWNRGMVAKDGYQVRRYNYFTSKYLEHKDIRKEDKSVAEPTDFREICDKLNIMPLLEGIETEMRNLSNLYIDAARQFEASGEFRGKLQGDWGQTFNLHPNVRPRPSDTGGCHGVNPTGSSASSSGHGWTPFTGDSGRIGHLGDTASTSYPWGGAASFVSDLLNYYEGGSSLDLKKGHFVHAKLLGLDNNIKTQGEFSFMATAFDTTTKLPKDCMTAHDTFVILRQAAYETTCVPPRNLFTAMPDNFYGFNSDVAGADMMQESAGFACGYLKNLWRMVQEQNHMEEVSWRQAFTPPQCNDPGRMQARTLTMALTAVKLMASPGGLDKYRQTVIRYVQTQRVITGNMESAKMLRQALYRTFNDVVYCLAQLLNRGPIDSKRWLPSSAAGSLHGFVRFVASDMTFLDGQWLNKENQDKMTAGLSILLLAAGRAGLFCSLFVLEVCGSGFLSEILSLEDT
jgi:hypothetical protein